MSAEGAAASSSDSSEKIEIVAKASELLAQGKRNMVCGEIPKAVNLYEEAVQMLVTSCGELSRDCADAYFNCGSALLELGRMETSVLGAALDGVDVEEEKEEEANEQFEKPPESEATEDVEEDDAEDEEESITEDKEGEEIEGEEKEEDVPNFQLAWEYLDLAKVIYLKSESADDQLKVAECHIKLGEISMETEQHVTAAEDIECALKIQQKLLPADDRLIAETHYQLGLAYGLGKDFALAIQHYTKAIGVVEAKIVSLKKLLELAAVDEDNKENQESDHAKKYKDEIKELQELIPEMRNKIDDAREESKDMDKMKQMAIEALGFSGPSKNFASPTKRTESNAGDKNTDVDENGEKKATDIAHLIRKKRIEPTPAEQGTS
uniref:Tetratricopeptide SHNi-TPR domain-containing protein n=1 Tax=Arion vulgaris TaxID=1028688 RepID=A0A0B7ABE9_9EUPU